MVVAAAAAFEGEVFGSVGARWRRRGGLRVEELVGVGECSAVCTPMS